MQIRFVPFLHQARLLMATPRKNEPTGFATHIAGEDLTEDAVRMDIANAIEIKCESSRASPFFRLKELDEFACITLSRQTSMPDVDFAILELGAITQDLLAPRSPRELRSNCAREKSNVRRCTYWTGNEARVKERMDLPQF